MNLSKNSFLFILPVRKLLISLALILSSLQISCESPTRSFPNFLVVLVDDLGAKDLGCYGQRYIQTPNIDLLASQGMRWTQAYASAPVCSPTRVALLTGKNQARVHFTGHITSIGRHRHPENSRIIPPNDLMDIPLKEVILPEALKPAGYKSISIGKWHVGRQGFWPLEMGFDSNIGGYTHGSPPSHYYPYKDPQKSWNPSIPTLKGGSPGEYLADRLTDEAIKFVRTNRDNHFLLYLPYYAVHKPLQAPQELIEQYELLVKGTKIDPVYAAMVHNLDENIGRLLAVLSETGLSENTVVIFASDNGAVASITDNSPYRLGKGHLYEGGIHVPLIIRWPGNIRPGSVSSNLTNSEDIFATIVDIVYPHNKTQRKIDGRSLVPDFNEKENNQLTLHWYYPHYAPQGNKPGAAIRSGKYKLIEFYDPPGIELYDLEKDIGEKIDLSKRMPDKREELLNKLHQWLRSVDPIMHTINPNH